MSNRTAIRIKILDIKEKSVSIGISNKEENTISNFWVETDNNFYDVKKLKRGDVITIDIFKDISIIVGSET